MPCNGIVRVPSVQLSFQDALIREIRKLAVLRVGRNNPEVKGLLTNTIWFQI